MSAARKSSYKLPPTAITDKLVSQEFRRTKALEEQKRRRARRIDSSRQLDLFAELTLGPSDDEGEAEMGQDGPEILREGLSNFAPMLEPISSSSTIIEPTQEIKSGVKKKSKHKRKARGKPNKWADKCMYAELLEMNEDDAWPTTGDGLSNDGLPDDLENGWVAVAPVPVGKRCLAVTHQSAGLAGAVPNTTLRSRVLGKSLIPRFPSSLPPSTILDCILDPNWKDNGILHVLDVVKWKGQDVGDCETGFRFWWRDTRLAELPQWIPSIIDVRPDGPSTTQPQTQHQFPYPVTFLPIPYHTITTYPVLSSQIIPLARSSRTINIHIPSLNTDTMMDIDTATATIPALVKADGLLLYIAQASYEPGTSPLSTWIPIVGYSTDQKMITANTNSDPNISMVSGGLGPLDLFEKLVKRRMSRNQMDSDPDSELGMDVES